MKRRGFLGAASAGVGAGLGVALWPAWLREAFADEVPWANDCDKTGESRLARLAVLAAAYRAASDAKRPLLVFVIPDNDMDKYERGQAFGELLNHGDDKQLAPLSRADVVCATMADLKKLVPTVGVGEPLMVLVSTDRVPAAARQLHAALPSHASFADSWNGRGAGGKEEQISKQRIGVMAGLVRRALGEADQQATTLAAEVRKRMTKKPPRGARWARSAGCGTEIEGDTEPMAIGCGMGHVPAHAQRFLYFFTKRVF